MAVDPDRTKAGKTITDMDELLIILDRWVRRLRAARSLRWGAAGLSVGLGLGLLLGVIGALMGSTLQVEFLSGSGIMALAGLAVGAAAGALWPVRPLEAAREFDSVFGMQERMSTAIELQDDMAPTSLSLRQQEDALDHARRIDVRRSTPLRAPQWAVYASATFLAAIAAFTFYGRPLFETASSQRQAQSAFRRQAADIESLIESIESNPELTKEQKEALIEPLEKALAQLDEAETLEEAYSTLEEAAQALEGLQDPGAREALESLQKAGDDLAGSESGPLDSTGESLARGDLEQAVQDLYNLDPASMNASELEQLASQLEALAGAVESVDPALAEELRAAARAARDGDAEAARQALQQAAGSLEDLRAQAAASEAAGEAASAVQGGQQEIVAAGQLPAEGAGSQGDPAGQGPGQGGADPAGGAGDGSSQNGGQPGPEAGNVPIGQGNNPDGSGQSDFQPIDPSSIGGNGSDWVLVPPSGADGENITGTGPSDPGNAAPAEVPYIDVLPQYQSAASEAVDSGLVPAQYRDLVRDYFSSLEP